MLAAVSDAERVSRSGEGGRIDPMAPNAYLLWIGARAPARTASI